MTVHTVIFDEGAQPVVAIAHRQDGEAFVPSTPTYGIVDLRHGDTSTDRVIVAAGTSATVGAVSVVVTGAGPAEVDPHILTTSTVVGIVEGERFLLDSNDGRTQVIWVDRIIGTTQVRSRDPITRNYPATSNLVSVEVTATFPLAEADDEDEVEGGGGPYAIDWDFDGQLVREIIWIKRTEDRIWATKDDLRTLDQTLEREIGTTYRLETFIVQGHRDFRTDLREAGIDPNRLDGSTLRDGVAARAAWSGRAQLGATELAKVWDDRYRSILLSVTIGKKPDGTTVTDRDDEADPGTTNVIGTLWAEI